MDSDSGSSPVVLDSDSDPKDSDSDLEPEDSDLDSDLVDSTTSLLSICNLLLPVCIQILFYQISLHAWLSEMILINRKRDKPSKTI